MVGMGDGVAGVLVASADAVGDTEGVASFVTHADASAVPATASPRRKARRRIYKG